MKKAIFLTLLLGLVGLSGCITIEESYSFNADGSGTMNYTIDFTEFAAIMEQLNESGEMGDVQGENEDPMNDLKSGFKEKLDLLDGIDGISNVKINQGTDKYVYALSYDFKDVDALNKALNKLINQEGAEEHVFFKSKGKTLVRESILGDFGKELIGSENDADAAGMEMAEMMLSELKYNLKFTFEKGLKSVRTDASGVLTEDKKQYSLDMTFKDMIERPEAMNITFKRNK